MFKNPWTGLIISFIVKFVAFFVIRTVIANAVDDLIKRRPDLAHMYPPK